MRPTVYDYFNRPPRRSVKFNRPTMTEQDHHEETDIGEMISRMARGVKPAMNTSEPIFGDFTEFGDYREMIDRKNRADEAFNRIPVDIRKRFENNPEKLLEFLNDDVNRLEAIQMGFFPEPKKESPPPTEEVQAG